MTTPADEPTVTTWAERVADRSPSVQRSRARSLARAEQIIEAAQRLVAEKGTAFTTHELVKEAGIAIQTFYKHFESKDQVLLAVIEAMVSGAARELELVAQDLPDPVARLQFYVTEVVGNIGAEASGLPGPRFITAEHWRLQQSHPVEIAEATRPFTTLLLTQLVAAAEDGSLHPANPEHDAWLATQLIMAVFHHYAFAPPDEAPAEAAERLWMFCFMAWGGRMDAKPARRMLRRTGS